MYTDLFRFDCGIVLCCMACRVSSASCFGTNVRYHLLPSTILAQRFCPNYTKLGPCHRWSKFVSHLHPNMFESTSSALLFLVLSTNTPKTPTKQGTKRRKHEQPKGPSVKLRQHFPLSLFFFGMHKPLQRLKPLLQKLRSLVGLKSVKEA